MIQTHKKQIILLLLIIVSGFTVWTIFYPANVITPKYKISWKKSLPFQSFLVFVGDINNDGYDEFIVRENVYLFKGTPNRYQKIAILNASGAIIQEFNVSDFIDKNFSFSLFVQAIDVDLDGTYELVILDQTEKTYNNRTYLIIKILCISWEGMNVLWSREYNISDHKETYNYQYKILDINGDSVSDTLFLFENLLMAINCRDGSLIWMNTNITTGLDFRLIVTNFDKSNDNELEVIVITASKIYNFSLRDGRLYWTLNLHRRYSYIHSVFATTYDIDNDNAYEVYYVISADIGGVHRTIVGCVSSNLEFIWNVTISRKYMFGVKTVNIDINKVGLFLYGEIILVLDAKTGDLVWSKNDTHAFSVTVGDLDGDKSDEIIFTHNTTIYFISSSNGEYLHIFSLDVDSLLSEIPTTTTLSRERPSLEIFWEYIGTQDFDNDLQDEVITIVTVCKANRTIAKCGTFLIILDGDGRKLSSTYISTAERVRKVMYRDLDLDGIIDIILLSEDVSLPPEGGHSYLYVLKIIK